MQNLSFEIPVNNQGFSVKKVIKSESPMQKFIVQYQLSHNHLPSKERKLFTSHAIEKENLNWYLNHIITRLNAKVIAVFNINPKFK